MADSVLKPTLYTELQAMVEAGQAQGPFEGGGTIEQSKSYQKLMTGFTSGSFTANAHPEDAAAFLRSASGFIAFWVLPLEGGKRCVVRKCAVSGVDIVVRTSDIQHTRVSRAVKGAGGGAVALTPAVLRPS